MLGLFARNCKLSHPRVGRGDREIIRDSIQDGLKKRAFNQVAFFNRKRDKRKDINEKEVAKGSNI